MRKGVIVRRQRAVLGRRQVRALLGDSPGRDFHSSRDPDCSCRRFHASRDDGQVTDVLLPNVDAVSGRKWRGGREAGKREREESKKTRIFLKEEGSTSMSC